MRPGTRLTPLLAPLLLVGAALLGTASPATAAPGYPRPAGRCVDTTGVLGAALCAKVTAVLLRDERRHSDEIAVAVVSSTGDASIETWSTGLFNTWGVGERGRDNGVLLVVATDDRRVRLETGRGMADRLPDSVAGEIVSTVITPRFAQGAPVVGVLAGLDEVRRRLGHPVAPADRLAALAAFAPNPAAAAAPAGSGGTAARTGEDDEVVAEDEVPDDFVGQVSADDSGLPAMVVLVIGVASLFGLVALFALIARAGSGSGTGPHGSGSHHRPRRRSSWDSSASGAASWSASAGTDSSSGSGGGASFGGGSSDGGGSSGSW